MRLQSWSNFAHFVSAISSEHAQPVHPLSDELSSPLVTILTSSCALPWAFPRFEMQAFLVLEVSATGGQLQILPNIRELLESENAEATSVVSTLIDAMEVERELVELEMEPLPPLRDILADMDSELGATHFSEGPLAVRTIGLSPGDLVLLSGPQSLFRKTLLAPTQFWQRSPQYQRLLLVCC